MGYRISVARKNRGLSQRQLARLVNVEPNTISMYENSSRKPSTDVVIKLARTLHVSTDYLLLGDRKNYIDASGLEDRDVSLIHELVDLLRNR